MVESGKKRERERELRKFQINILLKTINLWINNIFHILNDKICLILHNYQYFLLKIFTCNVPTINLKCKQKF